MATKIIGTRPLRIPGGFITECLRRSPNPHGDAAKAQMSLTSEQVQKILDLTARIEGDNVDGYEYVEER